MKLALVHSARLLLPGGGRPLAGPSLAIWNYEVARERVALGDDVTVYGPKPGLVRARQVDHEGAHFVELPTGIDERLERWASRIVGARSPRWPAWAQTSHLGSWGLRTALDARRRGVDAILVTNESPLIPALRALNPRAKIVLHHQCEWATQLDPIRVRPRFEACDALTGCSEFIAERIRLAFPDLAARVSVLHNGVRFERFPWSERDPITDGADPTILFLGRLSPEKGVTVLLDAFTEVARRVPRARLVLVGSRVPARRDFIVDLDPDPLVRPLARHYATPDAWERHLRSRIPEELAERVELRDAVPQAELLDALHAASAFCFPSLWNEPFGMPVIEAMAAGTPVVTTTSGGIPEFVADGEDGLLVPRGDASALAEALTRVLSDAGLRATMRRAGRARVERGFGWAHVAARLGEQLASVGLPAEREEQPCLA